MKISERSGMWVEMERSADSDDEITVRVPNGIWVGWALNIHVKEDDIATFLQSIGWHVDVPRSAGRATGAMK